MTGPVACHCGMTWPGGPASPVRVSRAPRPAPIDPNESCHRLSPPAVASMAVTAPREVPQPMSHRVTLIPGDGVGAESTDAARRVIDAAGVVIDWEVAAAGAEVFKLGDTSGVPRE